MERRADEVVVEIADVVPTDWRLPMLVPVTVTVTVTVLGPP